MWWTWPHQLVWWTWPHQLVWWICPHCWCGGSAPTIGVVDLPHRWCGGSAPTIGVVDLPHHWCGGSAPPLVWWICPHHWCGGSAPTIGVVDLPPPLVWWICPHRSCSGSGPASPCFDSGRTSLFGEMLDILTNENNFLCHFDIILKGEPLGIRFSPLDLLFDTFSANPVEKPSIHKLSERTRYWCGEGAKGFARKFFKVAVISSKRFSGWIQDKPGAETGQVQTEGDAVHICEGVLFSGLRKRERGVWVTSRNCTRAVSISDISWTKGISSVCLSVCLPVCLSAYKSSQVDRFVFSLQL